MQRGEARQHRLAEPASAGEERRAGLEPGAPQVPLNRQPGRDPGEAAGGGEGPGQPRLCHGEGQVHGESAAGEEAQHTGESRMFASIKWTSVLTFRGAWPNCTIIYT